MSYDAMFQKAIELQNAGALQQAEEIYMQLLQVMPENSDLWNLLGLLAQSKGDLIYARDCFLRAIQYAPTPFFMHFFNLGLVYKSLNQNKEAIDALQKSVMLKNDFVFGWQQLGILYAENGDIEVALNNFRKAIALEANFVDALADLYFFGKQYEQLLDLAAKEKDNYEAQYRAALIVEDAEKKELLLQRAIQAAPERTDPLLLAAKVKIGQNKNKDALIFYFKALNLDDKNLEAILGIADIYLAEKNFAEAEKYYQKSFDLRRDVVGAHINYGTLLYQQNRLTEALKEYEAAVTLAPEKSELSYNLALILKETGDIEEALGLMFNALLKEPENEVYALNIMETLIALAQNNKSEALKVAENWQRNMPNNIFAKKMKNILCGKVDEANDVIYVKHLFDNFAETYESTLKKLTPLIINRFNELYAPIKGKILDLGCGTGLAAEKLKNQDNIFVGVDVAEKMLAVAERKNLYQKLYKTDIVSFLQNDNSACYDFVLAFDVLCYIGDLMPIFKLLKQTKISFSVELATENHDEDYYISVSGRYKHKKAYIQRLLNELGFSDIKMHELAIRQENGKDVQGLLVVAETPKA